MRLTFLLLMCAALLTASTAHLSEDNPEPLSILVQQQAEDIMESMTLREKIAQLFIIRANGEFLADDNRRFLALKRDIEEYKVGGIIFFAGQNYNQAVLTNRLQSIAQIPLWIAQDMEYGAAMRVTDATRITPAMGVAATGNPQWAFEKGRITAMEARAIGVHQIYAPVVDVNNNPANPVINVRSFSEDPAVVSEFANAFIRGVQSQGLVATAKHFPGHGDTGVDSHLALPVIRHSMERMDNIELIPFREAINAGVGSVMTAHIAFPNISEDPRRPATLDPFFMTELLQNQMGFNGLVVTDALEMAGIANHYAPGEAAILALLAGADMILLSPDEMSAISHIENAVNSGRIPLELIENAVSKILYWKIDYGLFNRRHVDINRISSNIATRHTQMIADEIARESITVLRNRNNILPISPDRFPRITLIAVSNHTQGETGKELHSEMSRFHPNISFFNYDSRTSSDELDEMVRSARNANLVLVGSFLHLATGERLSFDSDQRAFISRLQSLNKPFGLISFSSPYIVREVPEADIHMLAWSMAGSQPKAAASALFGASAVGGTLPISIPGFYTKGAGLNIPKTIIRRDTPETVRMSTVSLLEVDRIMNRAIEDSVFPGGTVAVVRDGVLAYHEAYGYLDYNKIRRTRINTIYDLASLTKPLATTLAVMRLYDQGRLSLDTPVSQYFPEFSTGEKANITVRQLLNHTSGLPAYREYVNQHRTRDAILRAVKNEPLINEPGSRTVYSDLGFILLGEIVASITGTGLDTYLRQEFYGPMRISDTGSNPSRRGNAVINRTAPSEIDTTYRNKTIRAEVHDERAYYMGGVAGHAGLFSTTGNLSVLIHMLMNDGTYAGREFIKPETIAKFTKRPDGGGRALGFDLKTLNGFTTAGSLSSDNTFGHLGFTGTSFWIDPDRNLAVIILTNRTYPYRGTASGINRVRAGVMDAVIESIIE